jgi:hypothetical protein
MHIRIDPVDVLRFAVRYSINGEGFNYKTIYQTPQKALLFALEKAVKDKERLLHVWIFNLSRSEQATLRGPAPAMAFAAGSKMSKIVYFL